ncbi:uncharacterized protein LOC135827177 [Sycon ciliatum]|uniref:uncharacterized protein LOC135827177 n=1 Tax=Sycon ciliatum TaxID=27933 RepID=UPI0031F71DEB
MSSNQLLQRLRVAELREQLEKRGLDPSGTKSVLINRLEGAVDEREDFVPATAASVAVTEDPDNSGRDNFQQELRRMVREEVSAAIGTALSGAPEAASQTMATVTLSNPAPSIPGLSSIASAPAASSTETSAAAHLLVPKSLQDRIVKGISAARSQRQEPAGQRDMAPVHGEVSYYAACAIAPNTRRTYSTGESRYSAYCQLCLWKPFPATDYQLSCFAAFLARSVRPCTISVYLSAVRNAQIEQGLGDPLEDAWLLKRVVKGIGRCHGTAVITPRLPITMPVLRKIMDACQLTELLNRHDRLLYQACMLLAFYGFLRCSEFTGETRRTDARLADGNMQLFLPKSKTDPLGSGVTVFVGRATQPYCPVAAMTAYLLTTRHHPSTGPLFVLSDGQKLTRAAFTTTVRSLLAASGVPNLHLYSGHSFRIGAATTAAMAGVPDSLIRAAGRQQPIYFLYVHVKQNEGEIVSEIESEICICSVSMIQS